MPPLRSDPFHSLLPLADGRQRLYAALLVIELEDVSKYFKSLAACPHFPQIEALPFVLITRDVQSSRYPSSGPYRPGDSHTGNLERLNKFQTGKLRTLVRIKNFRHTVTIHTLLPELPPKFCIHRVRQMPSKHGTAVPVHNCHTRYRSSRFIGTYAISAHHT